MKTRKCISLFLVFAMALVLPACSKGSTSSHAASNSSSSSSQASKPVNINMLYTWPECQATMTQSIKLIEDKNPGLTITPSIVSWDKVNQQLQTSIAAGKAPDVSFMWPASMGSYVSTGSALDLTSYLQADGSAWENQFIAPSLLNSGTYNGKVYAVPFRGTGVLICYNKTIFDSNGWKVPGTAEELVTLMDKMLAKGVQPFALAGKPDGMQVGSVAKFLYLENMEDAGTFNDPNWKKGLLTNINGPYADAFEEARNWFNKGYFGKGADVLATTTDDAQANFFNKGAAMLLCNNNELTSLRKLAGNKFELGFMDFPKKASNKEPISTTGFDGFFAYSKTKNPDAAAKVLEGLTSTEVQNLWANNADALSMMVVKGVTYNDKDLGKMAESMQYAGKTDQIPDYSTADSDLAKNKAFANFLITPSETPKQLEQKWNDLTKQAIAGD